MLIFVDFVDLLKIKSVRIVRIVRFVRLLGIKIVHVCSDLFIYNKEVSKEERVAVGSVAE